MKSSRVALLISVSPAWVDFAREAAGGEPVAGHHSTGFRVAPEPSIRAGVESTGAALLELMGR